MLNVTIEPNNVDTSNAVVVNGGYIAEINPQSNNLIDTAKNESTQYALNTADVSGTFYGLVNGGVLVQAESVIKTLSLTVTKTLP